MKRIPSCFPISTARCKDNRDLSADRAVNITPILTQDHPVNPKSVTASGRAAFQPRASADGRAQNRRTESLLVPQPDALFQLIESSKTKYEVT